MSRKASLDLKSQILNFPKPLAKGREQVGETKVIVGMSILPLLIRSTPHGAQIPWAWNGRSREAEFLPMKAGAGLIFLLLGLAVGSEARPGELAAESNGPLPGSAVHGRILELLKEDAKKLPLKPKGATAPPVDPPTGDLPVAEGVLELEPIIVTQKKAIELPPRASTVTLDNFFYGDGTIFENADKRFSLSAGPTGNGLAAIKFNIRF